MCRVSLPPLTQREMPNENHRYLARFVRIRYSTLMSLEERARPATAGVE